MLTTSFEMLQKAYEGHYAVPAINTQGGTYDIIRAICMAAEELKSPIILAHYVSTGEYSGHDWFFETARWMAEKVSVPVAVHLDHGDSFERCMEMLKIGFTSIMYDCSTDSYENNVRRVARMVEIAHLFGATVEGELGHVGANETGSGDEGIYTQPEQARDFVERTGVDALAVAIGTAHGAYKEKPKLDIGRLSQIAHTVSTPLVLHGGSGLSNEDFKNCVANGICKVNIFTDINCAAARAAHDGYREGCGLTDLQDGITQAVKEETMKKMRVFGSAGRG